MTEQEMKLLHERMKKEDPRLLVLMKKCFDAGVMSGKEQAQRAWVGLTDENRVYLWKATETDNRMVLIDATEAFLKERNQ